jgi:5'(3')-deoxyribonucleotidase
MSQDTLNTARPVERKLKVVGCDLDDVLANFMEKFIDMARERYGIPENRDLRPVDWSWSNMGWIKDQEAALWQQLHDTPNFWMGLSVQPGVDPALVNRLSERTRMYFPTARAQSIGDDVAVQCARWLLNTFCIPFPTVIVGNEKGPLAAALKYDYFIDDRDKNCLEVKKARPECNVFLANSGHNQAFNAETHGILRVSGFNEFAEIVLAEA